VGEHRADTVLTGLSTRVIGWAIDQAHPDQPVTIRVRYYASVIYDTFNNSVFTTGPHPRYREGTTGAARPDVAAAEGPAGTNSGFVIDLPGDGEIVQGTLAVYAVAQDGTETLLGPRIR
jgi:hypothetical protein